jgi:hypothetical protein
MATVQELSTDIKSSAVLQETFGGAADSARYWQQTVHEQQGSLSC